ncbi:hypothetical protein [[Acholeplasma] multilocale]|uniref:hypothetical protein n=1 Tax=[Acholeplasma] multilocale TaxID=264638 RepID=UPI00047BB777|nr:hypothetical protein [[Acholeplasma] multilocale]
MKNFKILLTCTNLVGSSLIEQPTINHYADKEIKIVNDSKYQFPTTQNYDQKIEITPPKKTIDLINKGFNLTFKMDYIVKLWGHGGLTENKDSYSVNFSENTKFQERMPFIIRKTWVQYLNMYINAPIQRNMFIEFKADYKIIIHEKIHNQDKKIQTGMSIYKKEIEVKNILFSFTPTLDFRKVQDIEVSITYNYSDIDLIDFERKIKESLKREINKKGISELQFSKYFQYPELNDYIKEDLLYLKPGMIINEKIELGRSKMMNSTAELKEVKIPKINLKIYQELTIERIYFFDQITVDGEINSNTILEQVRHRYLFEDILNLNNVKDDLWEIVPKAGYEMYVKGERSFRVYKYVEPEQPEQIEPSTPEPPTEILPNPIIPEPPVEIVPEPPVEIVPEPPVEIVPEPPEQGIPQQPEQTNPEDDKPIIPEQKESKGIKPYIILSIASILSLIAIIILFFKKKKFNKNDDEKS